MCYPSQPSGPFGRFEQCWHGTFSKEPSSQDVTSFSHPIFSFQIGSNYTSLYVCANVKMVVFSPSLSWSLKHTYKTNMSPSIAVYPLTTSQFWLSSFLHCHLSFSFMGWHSGHSANLCSTWNSFREGIRDLSHPKKLCDPPSTFGVLPLVLCSSLTSF